MLLIADCWSRARSAGFRRLVLYRAMRARLIVSGILGALLFATATVQAETHSAPVNARLQWKTNPVGLDTFSGEIHSWNDRCIGRRRLHLAVSTHAGFRNVAVAVSKRNGTFKIPFEPVGGQSYFLQTGQKRLYKPNGSKLICTYAESNEVDVP